MDNETKRLLGRRDALIKLQFLEWLLEVQFDPLEIEKMKQKLTAMANK